MLVLLKTIFGIFTISVHVAQRLEYLTGHQKATGCTYVFGMCRIPLYRIPDLTG